MIFSEQKVAQMAAFFLARRGGHMSHMKLIKLLYLADRESMARYDVPMSDDVPCSMRNGPILSATLNLMNGNTRHDAWSAWISPIQNNEVRAQRQIRDWDELDELSRADLEVLEAVFRAHGHKERWELVEYTHTLPEWENPGNSSVAIDQARTFQALGCSEAQAQEKASAIQLRKQLGRKLSEMS